MKNLDLRRYKDFDWALIASAVAIFILGLLFLFSSTYPNNVDYVLRQIVWFLSGALIFIFIVNVNYRKIVGIGNVFYFLTVFLLAAVLMYRGEKIDLYFKSASEKLEPASISSLIAATMFLK